MSINNILVEETKYKFGYCVSTLKHSSEKLVVWRCGECNILQDKKFRSAKKTFLCLLCSNKINAISNLEKRKNSLREWHKKNLHPLLGIKRTQEVKDLISKANKGRKVSDELKRILSLKNSGVGNPMFGKKHTKESIAKMSEAQSKSVFNKGENSNFYGKKPRHGKGSWYHLKNGEQIWMRSTWETKFAAYLDAKDIEWLYETKTFNISYSSKQGTYTPDFFLVKENKFIEIKGWWRDDAFEKYIAFIEQHKDVNIEIMDRLKLKELNIL